MEGYWLHEWEEETSWDDPDGRWSTPEDRVRRCAMWIPNHIDPDDMDAIETFIDESGWDLELWEETT